MKKRSGREVHVYIDGVLQSLPKVQREIARQAYESTVERLCRGNCVLWKSCNAAIDVSYSFLACGTCRSGRLLPKTTDWTAAMDFGYALDTIFSPQSLSNACRLVNSKTLSPLAQYIPEFSNLISNRKLAG